MQIEQKENNRLTDVSSKQMCHSALPHLLFRQIIDMIIKYKKKLHTANFAKPIVNNVGALLNMNTRAETEYPGGVSVSCVASCT